MDRGFGGSFRGGFSGNRNLSDRRYDDFYSDNNRRGGGGGRNNVNRNRGNNNAGDWGGSNRDRGFFNQGVQGGAARNRGAGGNVNGQMLAALQQQQSLLSAFMSTQSRGLLPSPNANSSFNQQQGGNKFGGRFDGRFGGRFGGRPGDKRKYDTGHPSGFNKRKRPQNQKRDSFPKQGRKEEPARKEKQVPKEEEIDIPDDEVDIPDSLMDSVEKLRQRKDFERNVADEDVQKLLVFSFTGKGYHCVTCGLLLMKETAFIHHLMGKSHVMNVIDTRTAKKYQETRDILDIDLSPDDWYEKNEKARAIILKQAKMFMKTQMEIQKREQENYNKNPSNFFTIEMESRKAAMKSGNVVTIKSLVESTIEVKEFNGNKLFGCEFVKAVSSFHCRLCGLHIKEASGVIPHIDSRLHQNNYQNHLKKNKDYEKTQQQQNSELFETLEEHEDKYVLLSESDNAGEGTFLSSFEEQLVRVPKLLQPAPVESENPENEKVAQDEQMDVKKEESATEEPAKEESADKDVETQQTEVKDEVKVEEIDEEIDDNVADKGNAEDEEPNKATDEVHEEAVEVSLEAESTSEQTDSEPKPKSILKKTTPGKTRGGGAKRGGRGKGRGTPSPRPRSRRAKEDAVEATPEASSDGHFMDGFQVVDEVDDE